MAGPGSHALRRVGLPLLVVGLTAGAAAAAEGAPADGRLWLMSAALFGFCVVIGCLAVIAGVGGGVMFVPLVSAVFPFHLDFVRGAGLLIALAGSLSSAPKLLSMRLANMHLVLPCAVLNSLGAMLGAALGLHVRRDVIELLLGLAVLLIVVAMWRLGGRGEEAPAHPVGPLARRLLMEGVYRDGATGEEVRWHAWRARWGLLISFGIGLIAGLFGVGAGWANVPTFALLMGVPLKVATASSVFLISIGDVAAAWVYLTRGAVLPPVAVPSMLGLMCGSALGARLLHRARPRVVRLVVIAILLLAAGRVLHSGLGSLLGGAG